MERLLDIFHNDYAKTRVYLDIWSGRRLHSVATKVWKNGATSNGQWYAVSSSTSRIFTASNSISAFIFPSHTNYCTIRVPLIKGKWSVRLSSGRRLRVNVSEVTISDMFYVLNKTLPIGGPLRYHQLKNCPSHCLWKSEWKFFCLKMNIPGQ